MDLDTLAGHARQAAIDQVAQEEIAGQPGGLLTPDMASQKAAADVDRVLQEFASRIVNGLGLLRDQHARLKGTPGHEAAIAFLEPDFFSGKEAALVGPAEEDGEHLDLQAAFGISDEDLERAHNLAAAMLDEDRAEDASAALLVLANLAPGEPALATSLAFAEYRCGRIDQALRCYELAYVANPDDARPLVHAAFCLEKLGEKDAARDYLSRAQEVNQEAGDDQVAQEIEQLLQRI